MSKLSELIPNRVRALRMDRGWTLQELAERAGTTAPQIMKLEKSHRRLDLDWIERLAKAFEISEQELLVGPSGATASVRMVPLIGDIAAGNWREAIQHADGSVAAVGASAEAFGLRARGDSMNLLVADGGYVVVEPGLADLRDGRVYAVMNEEGETTVKRFRTDPARLEPCSSNPDHKEIPLGRSPFTVIGQVTGAFVPL
nr:S24 family peptidase [uncultured Sphingomonas sp.]